MNVLILGEQGQLGTELSLAPWPTGFQIRTVSQQELDFTQLDALPALLDSKSWQLVVNAAAYTAVDKAESEPDLAFAINRDAPAAIAQQCAVQGVPLVHVSTDYVFDGTKSGGYLEDDPIAPLNVYGQSKAAGEAAVRKESDKHLILRTSWLYSAHGHNFVKSMMRLANERDELRIVNDQHGCPTSARDLAGAICQIGVMMSRGEAITWGTYHYAGRGVTTWFGFAHAVLDEYQRCGGKRPKLVGIPSSEYPTPAKRPTNSQLDCSRIEQGLGIRPLPWQDSCAAVVHECCSQELKVS